MLACGTKPIIEASSGIQFGCFDVGYQALTGVALLLCSGNSWHHLVPAAATPSNWLQHS